MRTLLLALFMFSTAAYADPAATERYAPAQLQVAHDLLERARLAAASGDSGLAGKLAWQASLDARLTWGMTESEALRAEAAEVGGEARALVSQLAGGR